MNALEIKPNIFWVGAIDWDIRNFHGYLTPKGTTYNSYLIIDDKITLVDTVKNQFFEEMLTRIKKVVEPDKIEYIVVNHVEMDHSGSLPHLLELAPAAKVITSPNGKRGLIRHYRKEWNFVIVNSGEEIKIGENTLKFFHMPMVHWPDSMATYIVESRALLPNDAFGQHIATFERFDEEIGWDILKQESAKYYSNIVMPYAEQVKKVLDAISNLKIEVICPSHGVVWRKFTKEIIESYRQWASNETEKKALVIYDTMWGSTKKIAYAISKGIEEAGIPVIIRNLQTNHISDIITGVLSSRAICIGSPTLNNGMLPSVSGFLTYLKGLRPKNRIGLAFGSYGWGGQGAKEVAGIMESMGWEMPLKMINFQYIPDDNEIEEAYKTGKNLGDIIKNLK